MGSGRDGTNVNGTRPQRVTRPGQAARLSLLLVGLGLLAMAGSSVTADTPRASVHDVKAAFLFKFIKYVTWPENPGEIPSRPFVIGVFGDDSIHEAVDAIAAQLAGTRPFEIRHYDDPVDLDTCQILFVGRSRRYRSADVLARVPASGTLTVGDARDFITAGGAIGLAVMDNRVRFEVNLAATRAADLHISSKLLRLAVKVEGAEAGELN